MLRQRNSAYGLQPYRNNDNTLATPVVTFQWPSPTGYDLKMVKVVADMVPTYE